MKTCSKCHTEKNFDQFHKQVGAKDGLTSWCKSCRAELTRAWCAANPDKVKAHCATSRVKNREKRLLTTAAWHAANPEKAKAHRAKWRAENPDKRQADYSVRRASKLRACPAWSEKEKINLVYAKAKQLGLCVDHVVPLRADSVCGLHVWHNLQLLDTELNQQKGNRFWPDMGGF